MDGQSEQPQEATHPLEHLGNWKVVVGIGGVIAVILVLSFILTFLQSRMYPETPGSSSTQNVQGSSPVSAQPTDSLAAVPTGFVGQTESPQLTQQHLSNNFSMKYPSGWTESETTSLGSIVVTFTSDDAASSSPQMIVSSLDLTQANYTLSSGADLYRDYGYQETSVQIDHLSAVKLAGVFPPPILKLKNAGPVEWATNIYVTKGTNDYMIRYIYLGGKDPKYEKLFSDMLSTLQLR